MNSTDISRASASFVLMATGGTARSAPLNGIVGQLTGFQRSSLNHYTDISEMLRPDDAIRK